jgi:hypothetical protein
MRITTGPVLIAAVAAALVAGCSSAAPARPATPGVPSTTVDISSRSCGHGWVHPHSGLQTFQLRNQGSGAAEVYLIDPLRGSIDPDQASAPVYAEIEDLGPGTTAPMQVNVGSGAYAFECELQYYGTIIGPIVQVPGHAKGTPGVLSVTFNDLVGSPSDPFAPALAYREYVTSGLQTLAQQTAAIATDLNSGNIAAARRDWLAGHLTYERLGAAYGTFGDYDSEIDGRPDGLVGGVSSPQFTGFYRVEYGLWHGESAPQLAGPARTLHTDVVRLQAAFPHLQLALSDLGLRTHEILENALQFQLTGHDDYGSGTTLATTVANIAGTRELLKVLHPLLETRYQQGLPAVNTWLDRLQARIEATRRGGNWVPVSSLTTSQHEQIDAAVGQALQDLAPIAAIFEVEKQF